MARYIDADLLVENICKIEDLRTLSTKTIGEAISNTPTADVVEVKHGEWKDVCRLFYGIRTFTGFGCTSCNKRSEWKSTYCPYCGAKMDLKERF